MFLDDTIASDGLSIANLFADHFSTVYTRGGVLQNASYICQAPVDLSSISVGISELHSAIDKMKNKLSTGPDGIPSHFIKKCVSTLVYPLHCLFRLSLASGRFPDFWKSSFVSVIYKSGDRTDVRNYRAVCIQSEIPKLLDKFVSEKVYGAFRNLIIPEQHGFMSGRSTVTNLLAYQNDILNSLENKLQVATVYSDLTKAFDRIDHGLLLHKLGIMGVTGNLMRWLDSFLRGRTQCVRVNGFLSRPIDVHSGVPQGSHCGPILFNLFLNDVASVFVHSRFLLFADDVKFYRDISSIHDCILLQEDINRFTKWCKCNGLSLNVNKCFAMSFYRVRDPINFNYSIDEVPMKSVTSTKDLGVTFTSDMSFNLHVGNIVSSAYKLLGLINRSSRRFSIDTFRLLYCSLVRTSLEYAAVVWSPYYASSIDRIEGVQRRFLLLCHFRAGGSLMGYSSSAMARQLSLLSLEVRRYNQDLLFLYKLMNNLLDCIRLREMIILCPDSRTRQRPLFALRFHSTNYTYHSPLARICRNFNNSNLQLFNISFSLFRRALLNS